MSKMGGPGVGEAMDEVPQVWGGTDTGAAQALAIQEREPDLDLIEPRAMSGQPMARNLGPLGSAPLQDGLFLMIPRVVHNQMPATVWVAGAQRPPEVAELQIGMALITPCEAFPSADLKGGKEIDGARAEILNLLAFEQPRTQGQSRLQAFQGLTVGLLIARENPTPARGMQVEIENLGPLLLKHGIGAGQEVTPAMRFEHQRR
jgi:hypothetical protein